MEHVHLTATQFVRKLWRLLSGSAWTGLRYSESGRQMFVDSEVVTGPSGMAVYKDTMQKWDPPYDNVPVSDSDRDRILNNIRDAFRSQGFEIDVI